MDGKNMLILLLTLVILIGSGFALNNHVGEKKLEEQAVAHQAGVRDCVTSIVQRVVSDGYVELVVSTINSQNETGHIKVVLVEKGGDINGVGRNETGEGR